MTNADVIQAPRRQDQADKVIKGQSDQGTKCPVDHNMVGELPLELGMATMRLPVAVA